MGIERKQSAFIDRFVRQAAELGAAESVANLVLEATSHPSLFAFAEILAIPNLSKLLASQYSSYLDVLLLFACGTWKIYQRHAHSLPVLLPDQVRKLKQISVLALIENEKELPYDQLMEELDVSNVQELEDFLIQECIHTGIVRGKLDQLRRCFKVQFASGRDLTAEHLANTIETSNSWFRTSSNLLHLIEEGIKWVECMNEINNQHKKEINDEIEEVEKAFKDHDGWSEIWDGTDEDCIGRKSRRRRRLEL
ncbi:COP9 signalosome complex subunit 7-like isoform X1 [Zingiber officinale]|uniref:COP9 signalosome complex subunit 7-like isoform X1 n=1 Tax=Zingiber officinale TaxID=94328 RepID=UPI001C4B5F15|nr:COP9 signalosome complex subunit 7-like isoform X1 [Zingiber officinale]XP_042417189.1 COP9 signalosome complex subunit 7-like isoform X1 [Zingiber officinale]